ncbi:MAG: hypothetical protein CSB34_05240 [Desulfobulbus propionicus]|nr:MAG: hypothetical protein CSB34_05240 [Desulfobulbus propionicus]
MVTEFWKRKKAAGTRWRIDETCRKVKGIWYDLYRAVDKEVKTIDVINHGICISVLFSISDV